MNAFLDGLTDHPARFFSAFFVFIALLVGAVALYEYEYPCLKSREYEGTCGGGMSCVSFGKYGCTVWMHHPTYPCTRTECLERGER